MTNRQERMRDLFVDAVEMTPERRGVFLDQACAGDADLRAELERLIKADADSSSFQSQSTCENDAPRLPPGKELNGRFRVLRFVAAGGMGDVYEVEDLELHEHIALKTIRPEIVGDAGMLSRFKREIQYAKRVTHPNVCRIYDLGSHREPAGEIVFLTMELLHGETLSSRLRSTGRMALPEALPLVIQMAEALSAAHDAGIIHRDFKPSNVILTGSGASQKAVVTDFGLARSSSRGEDYSITEAGKLIGTPAYMAPEQLTRGQLTPATDVYALGLVIYEMVTGHRPFEGDDSAMKRLSQPPVPPSTHVPELDARWQTVILRCLEREPARRFQRPQQVVEALTGASRPTRTLTQLRFRKLSRLSLVGVLLLLAVVTAGLFIGRRLWPPSQEPSREALRWYQEGVNAIRDGTYFKASKNLEQAIALAPQYALAHAYLAEAWMELEYNDKAREEMLRASPPVKRTNLSRSQELRLEAIHSTILGDFAGAVIKYQAIFKQTSDPDLADAYVDLGRAYEKNEKPKEAIRNYEEATLRSPQYAAAFLRLGALYSRAHDATKAQRAFDRAESQYRSLSNIEGETEVLYQRATAADSAGRSDEAREFAEKAIAVARVAGNVNQQVTAMLRLAGSQYDLGDLVKGQQSATDAMELARNNGLENLTTRGLIQVGNAALTKGDLSQAKQYYNHAIEYASRYKAAYIEMRARFSLASALVQEGNPDQALQQLEPAVAFFQQGGYRTEVARTLILLTRAKRQQGDYEGALHASHQQLENAKQIGNRYLLAIAEESIGSILSEQQRFSEALEHYKGAYAAAQDYGDKTLIGYELSNIGRQLGSLGRYPEARSALTRSLALADRPDGDKSLRAQIHLTLAQVALSRLRSAEATTEALKALKSEDRGVAIESHCTLAIAATFGNRAKEALKEADEAVQLAETLKSDRYLAEALFASALARLENGHAHAATDLAIRAQSLFARAGQTESEWKAWLVAARASKAEGDREKSKEYSSKASDTLAQLAKTWPASDYVAYLARPDIQRWRKQLNLLSL